MFSHQQVGKLLRRRNHLVMGLVGEGSVDHFKIFTHGGLKLHTGDTQDFRRRQRKVGNLRRPVLQLGLGDRLLLRQIPGLEGLHFADQLGPVDRRNPRAERVRELREQRLQPLRVRRVQRLEIGERPADELSGTQVGVTERNDRLAPCQRRAQLQVDPRAIERILTAQDDKNVCLLQVRHHAVHPVVTDGDTGAVRRHIHVDHADERGVDMRLDQVAELGLTAGVADKYLDCLHCTLTLPSTRSRGNPDAARSSNNAE